MEQMLADIEAHKPDQEPDYYFAFGYNQARAMTALLEKAVELGDLSHEGLLKASEELGTVSFDGLTGDYEYGPADEREPPRTSTIFEVDPDEAVRAQAARVRVRVGVRGRVRVRAGRPLVGLPSVAAGAAAAAPQSASSKLAGASRRGAGVVERGGLENRWGPLGPSWVRIPPPPLS